MGLCACVRACLRVCVCVCVCVCLVVWFQFLINNAGISTNPVRIHELSTQDWDKLMNVNLRGTYLCSKMVLPHMLREKNGSIINISSITGLLGFYPDLSGVSAAYSASKAGMMGFTRQLAAEYATDNIRCNAIAPGFHGGTDLGRERGGRSFGRDDPNV